MILSKACEYGIRSAIYVAHQSLNENRATLKDIAEEIDSPVAFTGKILQILTKNDLLNSIKGPTGGFFIKENKMKELKLIQIIQAIDGNDVFDRCGIGLSECSEAKPCPIHHKYKFIRSKIKNLMEGTTLFELANDVEKSKAYLKR